MLEYQNDEKVFKIFYDSEGCMIHITHGDNDDFISIPYERCLEARENFRKLFKNFPKSEIMGGYIYKKDDITSLKVKSGQTSFKLKIDEIVYNFTDKYEIASISKFLEGWWVRLSSNNNCSCMNSSTEKVKTEPETPEEMDKQIDEESTVEDSQDNVVNIKETSKPVDEPDPKEKESDNLDDELNDFLSSDDFLSDIDLDDA